ncbi:Oxidase ustYa [Paramyrothecium foliicola]|nr:Oxidase ustYa [Paramyrothecium foliicola]
MGAKHHNHDTNQDLKRISSYSPLLDEIDISLHSQRFNGRIHDNTSIFRQDPSPEVDAAWDRLTAEGIEIITVSEDAVILSGKTPGLSIKAPDSWGRGPQAYVAQVDVFHQIHCLNELRKEINFDYYYGSDSRLNRTSLPTDHIEHQKHCIHMLLQNLMCHADAGIVTHNWVHYEVADQPTRPYAEPFADFNVIKKCRNFDALLDWAQENAIKDLPKRWAELKMPEGAEFVSGDGYW